MNPLDSYIQEFKTKKQACKDSPVHSYAFGGDDQIATQLAELVYKGEKCGTTSLYDFYAFENEEIPKIDEISVILDGENNPICIVKNTNIEILKFKEITENHAFTEGEGDKSLEYWRDGHSEFFTNSCKEINDINFSEDSLVIFETFEVIYK